MNLTLKRPIAFFDIETTGINVASDRIVEISILKIHPDNREEAKTFRVNPQIPIPKAATDIHGITDEDIKDKPAFPQIAKLIAQMLEGCDFAGYNSNKFDIPLLAEEFLRTDIDFDMRKHKFIDVQVIFYKMEQRTLSAAYQFYCNKILENAHSSKVDTQATYEILKAQIDRYADLKNDVEFLSTFSSQNRNVDFAGRVILGENDTELFNFGKYKGQPVEEVFRKDPSYYKWMMDGDFTLNTKQVITQIKLKYFKK
ncbi:MAG: 3'-5' exonuclease [Bacteroidia bacterium]|nr:3'-5' exonuclease [Bacteroidia bacterium]